MKKKRGNGLMYPLEPIEPSDKELMSLLGGMSIDGYEPHDRRDEATVAAIRACGLRIVRSCELCAEPNPPRRPACPNVATITMQETRTHGVGAVGPIHVCQPHARGRKVYCR